MVPASPWVVAVIPWAVQWPTVRTFAARLGFSTEFFSGRPVLKGTQVATLGVQGCLEQSLS